jgi:MSHA pilin protein MshD
MCIPEPRVRFMRRQAGISLIELIMFILIVSLGVTGILTVMNYTTAHSADPLLRKQAIAVAESLLEEIELQPFTICDPDDPNVTTGVGCTIPEGFGVEGGETRTSLALPFDNVNDYVDQEGVEKVIPIVDVTDNTPIAALVNYTMRVKITREAVGSVTLNDCLRIDVRVTDPAGNDITLTGYRFQYAPTAA